MSEIGNLSISTMTMLEFFAARAPHVVPSWFEPNVPDKPKVRGYLYDAFGKHSGHKHADIFMKYYDEEGDGFPNDPVIPEDFRKEVEEHLEARRRESDAVDDWNANFRIQKITQWPWYWAEQVLKTQPKNL